MQEAATNVATITLFKHTIQRWQYGMRAEVKWAKQPTQDLLVLSLKACNEFVTKLVSSC